MIKAKNFTDFEDYLKAHIPPKEAVFGYDIGIKRSRYLMKLLGNPQNNIRVIHIAGTSGKGSTCYLASYMLASQGFQVGLSISPHMFDIRERIQINNKLPAKKLILRYFNQILPTIEKVKMSQYGSPTFFEINIALAYYIFAKENLDYAVMETGLGGRLDATNCVSSKNKISVITKIGFDHMELLGNTLGQIACEKCDIIQKNNVVISTQQAPSVKKVIEKKCESMGSQLYWFKENVNYRTVSSTPDQTTLDFRFLNNEMKNIHLGLIGQHQSENCSLALACLKIVSKRDNFSLNERRLRKALKKINIPGRFNVLLYKNKNVIIDGAHNLQKMKVFLRNLSAIYPNRKFTFLVSFKKGKDYKSMLCTIMPLAKKILLTSFSIMKNGKINSTDTGLLTKELAKLNYSNVKIINKSDILKEIIKSKDTFVITGSLYLIGSIYPMLKK